MRFRWGRINAGEVGLAARAIAELSVADFAEGNAVLGAKVVMVWNEIDTLGPKIGFQRP